MKNLSLEVSTKAILTNNEADEHNSSSKCVLPSSVEDEDWDNVLSRKRDLLHVSIHVTREKRGFPRWVQKCASFYGRYTIYT